MQEWKNPLAVFKADFSPQFRQVKGLLLPDLGRTQKGFVLVDAVRDLLETYHSPLEAEIMIQDFLAGGSLTYHMDPFSLEPVVTVAPPKSEES